MLLFELVLLPEPRTIKEWITEAHPAVHYVEVVHAEIDRLERVTPTQCFQDAQAIMDNEHRDVLRLVVVDDGCSEGVFALQYMFHMLRRVPGLHVPCPRELIINERTNMLPVATGRG